MLRLDHYVAKQCGFLEETRRVAPLSDPSLDDGVIVNFAPLWRLAPQNKLLQNELTSTWHLLCEGKYDWAKSPCTSAPSASCARA